MPTNAQSDSGYREYIAWDAPTRWFHWINALAVLGLIATGVAILTGGQLGLSPEGKVALKSVHVIFGYVMAVNLLWRSSHRETLIFEEQVREHVDRT
jgi:Ni,Fe-hydrogenase I cytochrome b subunit